MRDLAVATIKVDIEFMLGDQMEGTMQITLTSEPNPEDDREIVEALCQFAEHLRRMVGNKGGKGK